MMIEWKTSLLDCVIGRRGMRDTASSLWPCQKRCLPFYLFGIVLFFSAFVQVAPVMGEEQSVSADSPAAAESAAPDTGAPMTDIHDILPPVAVGPDVPWLWVVLIALGTAVLATLGWWLWKRREKKERIETIVPELPPELIARQALDQLSDVRGMDGKAFYFRLSAILRRYVFGRFGVGAPEMTTEEFLPCIDSLSIDKDLNRGLKRLCRAMDPVKFGGRTTAEKQMEADLFFTREFVRKTTETFQLEKEIIDIEPSAAITVENKNSNKLMPNLK
jgi:hypothetical protein